MNGVRNEPECVNHVTNLPSCVKYLRLDHFTFVAQFFKIMLALKGRILNSI